MKKSDLKTGMIVELKDGSNCIVMLDVYESMGTSNVLMDINDGSRSTLSNYSNDMKFHGHRYLDIIKVSMEGNLARIFDSSRVSKTITLWERKKPKEMTIQEIQEELGYEIEIVEKMPF